jgi:hypothetical protein
MRITYKADEGKVFVFGDSFVTHVSLSSLDDIDKYEQIPIEEAERIKAEREAMEVST